ncbi:hypothetical protein [Pseudomonas fragariae (ex Marin et al. 2024)]|uniref:Uncharacterized protein n=2 Tax=Pseudomonas fragariae (ex Marin et al. 2024) TaxID=3080056 RepID=A0ABU5B5F4_9PSED|nr:MULTISPECIES: hypothetical protein [unclassified Pseudomonas]MCW6058227.1 hypothetical protein [Pseudomonas fragi]MDV0428322.1 hypothetical protein [Pseudomonas sp. 17]MDX9573966.1 hypothetical protein [Pseudomonas sp. 21(2023)]MDX9586788.1 hypothetical protein [Pseudomonas sp. 19(2023)]MDY6478658.1 hypothetical protein [Pseudomonas sp. 18]
MDDPLGGPIPVGFGLIVAPLTNANVVMPEIVFLGELAFGSVERIIGIDVPRNLQAAWQVLKAARFYVLNEIINQIYIVGRRSAVDPSKVGTEIYNMDYAWSRSFSSFATHALRSCRDKPGGNDITPLPIASIIRGRSKVNVLEVVLLG